jgi:hypothetical protein
VLPLLLKHGIQNALKGDARGTRCAQHGNEEKALSDEQEVRYKVTFVGPVQNDLPTVSTLAGGLKDRFKLSDEAVTRMMKMAPVVIKKGATESEAQKYKQLLEAMGAKVQVDPIEEVPEEPQQTAESPPSADAETKEEVKDEVKGEGPPPLDREPQVIPVKAKAPPPASPEAAATKGTEPQMVQCPQCGYVQEQTDECVKCGVIISKVLKYQDTVKPPGVEAASPGPSAEGTQAQRIIGTPIDAPEGSTPWEDMASLGFFTALFRTMKEVLFAPSEFFRKMPVSKGLAPPLFYGVILGFVGALIAILLQVILFGSVGNFPGEQGVEGVERGIHLFQTTFIIIYAIFLPILIAVGLFIASGIFHLCLLIVGAGKRGFEATFRVVAYTSSTQVFAIVPVVGAFIVTIYNLVLWTIGFRESHRTTTGRAFIAVLLPMIVIVIFIILMVFAIVIPLVLSQSQMMMPQQPPSGF